MTVVVLDARPERSAGIARGIGARGYAVVHLSSYTEATAYCDAHPVHLLVAHADDGALADTIWLEILLESRSDLKVLMIADTLSAADMTHPRLHLAPDASDVDEVLANVSSLMIGRYLETADTLPREDFLAARRAYSERIPERVKALSLAVMEGCRGAGPLDVARYLAHRMHGTAASYGHSALGQVAGELEDCLLAIFARQKVEADDCRELDELLHRLGECVLRPGLPSGDGPVSIAPAPDCILVVSASREFVERIVREARAYGIDVLAVAAADVGASICAKAVIGAVFDSACGHAQGEDAIQLATTLRLAVGAANLPIVFVASDQQLQQRIHITEMPAVLVVAAHMLEQEFLGLARWMRGGRARHDFRVMIVDDDPDFVEEALQVLARMNVEGLALSSATDLLARLEEWNPDLLLLDIVMPEISGLEVCRALRKSMRWQALPIVLVTGRVDDALRLRAYRSGASDFVSKPLLAEELEARVGVRLDQIRLARDYAERDSLTSLWNRRRFLEVGQRVEARAATSGKRFAVAIVDLDHFKRINDRHGHLLGDQVLVRFGRLLTTRLREGDHACRWGGEEFLILTEDADRHSLTRFTERLLAIFSADQFYESGGSESFSCTFSSGIAELGADGATLSELLAVADRRLYAAKAQGRARVISEDEPRTDDP